MGQAGRLGQPIAPAALHRPVESSGQVHLVPDGDIDRGCCGLGAQGSPNHLCPIIDLGIAARLSPYWLMPSPEKGLGAADARPVEKEPQVSGKTHLPGMGDSLPVKDNEVGVGGGIKSYD